MKKLVKKIRKPKNNVNLYNGECDNNDPYLKDVNKSCYPFVI